MSGPDFPPVPDVAKIEFRLELAGAFGALDMQYEVYWKDEVATRDFPYLVDLADSALAAWADVDGVASLMDSTVTCRVRVVDLDTVTHLSADAAGSEPGIGSTDTWLPATVCAVLRIPNTEGGAPRSPYLRHGPLSESAVAGNTVSPSHRTLIEDAWKATFANLAAAQTDGDLVVVSVYEPKASGGGTPATLYRTTGVAKIAAPTAVTVRPLIGRAGSRQD